MNKKFIVLAIGLATLCSCEMSDKKDNNPGSETQKAEIFDFSTKQTVRLDAEFGPYAINGLVQIFTEDPTQYVQENGRVIDSYTEGDAVYNIYANQDGRANGDFTLPSYVDKVWVVLNSIVVGQTIECPVENGRIHINLDAVNSPRRVQAAAKAVDNYEVFDLGSDRFTPVGGYTNWKTLVKWWDDYSVSTYGKIVSDPNQLVSWDGAAYSDRTPIDCSDLQMLLKSLWKGNDYKPTGLNNSNLTVKDVSLVNTTIHARGGSNSTKLWFRFLDEHAWNQNTIGYYYYPEGTEASVDIKSLKKYIILPNASKPAHYPYCKPTSNAPYTSDCAPANSTMSVKLLFEDPVTGEVTDEFPAGYTVGFFCLSNAFQCGSDAKVSVAANGLFFSNDAFNASQTSRFICMSLQSNDKNFLVYGLEDSNGGDKSYEDILFVIDAENPEMVEEEGRKDVSEVTGETPIVNEHEYFTYGFEDIWDNDEVRDYDLNDVVVEHHRMYQSKKTSTMQKQLVSIIDYLEITSWIADYDDAFALQFAKAYSEQGSNNVSLKMEASANGADWISWTPTSKWNWTDDEGNSLRTYVVFDYKRVKPSNYRFFRITRTFNGTTSTDDVRATEQSVRPFIVPKWEEHVSAGKWPEIHLPGDQVTTLASNGGIGDAKYYFVDTKLVPGMQFPFAISLTLTKTERFEPSPEGVRIDKTYPAFVEWVRSHGLNAKDWYKKN